MRPCGYTVLIVVLAGLAVVLPASSSTPLLVCSFDECPHGVRAPLCSGMGTKMLVQHQESLQRIPGVNGTAIVSNSGDVAPDIAIGGLNCSEQLGLPLTLVVRFAASSSASEEDTLSLVHVFASPDGSPQSFPSSHKYPGISVYFRYGKLGVTYRTLPREGRLARYGSSESVLNSTHTLNDWKTMRIEISEVGVSADIDGVQVSLEKQYNSGAFESSQAFLAACDSESPVARIRVHFGEPLPTCYNVTTAYDYVGIFAAQASEIDVNSLPGDAPSCRATPSAPAVLPQTRYFTTPNLDIHRGLVSYWHFDDDSYIDEMDSSRFGFVELANVEGNYTRSAQGVLAGHGFRLDPGLDSGWLNLSSPIPLDGATAYSFSLWVQARDAFISGRDFFPGNLLYATSSAIGVYSLESTNAALTPSAVSDLFHIVYTCSGGKRALYVNGALERRQVGVSTVEFPALELIGRGDSESGLNVDIDDLRFYNYSLSGKEVTQLNQFCSSTDAVERVLKRIGNVYHCFQMFSDRITYSEAAARCNRLPNGHLATVTSYEENEMLQSLTESSGTINNGAYIGLRWTSRNGVNVHLWDNQEVGSYSNFASGFPRADGLEYCVIHSRYNFGWTEVSCAQDLPYICEQTSPILELCDRGSDHLMAYSGDSSEATCIEFVDDQHEGNWSESREMCHSVGGDLISLSDSNLLEAMGYIGGDGELAVFVGGSDFGNESVAITEWLNGEFIDESLLSEGLTNLTGCLVYVRDSEGNSSIEGRSCSDVLPFVCLRRIDLGESEGMDPLVYDATVRNTSHLGHFESSGCGYADEECIVHDGFLPVGSVIEVASVFNGSEMEPRRLVLSSVVLDAGKEELSVWLEDGGEGGTFLRVFGGDVNGAFEDLTSDQTFPVYVYGEYTIRIAVQISGYVVSLEYDSDSYEAYVQRLPTFSNTFRVEAFGFEKGYEASVYVDECGPVMEECVGVGNTCEVSGLRRGSVVRAVGPFDPSETFSIDFGTENGDRPFHLHYDPISFLGLRMYSALNGSQLPAENAGIDLGSGMRDLEFHIVVGARGYDLYILDGGNATSRVSTGLLHYFFESRSDAPITWLIFDGFGDEDSLVRYDVYDAPDSDCYPAYDPAACGDEECSSVIQEGLVFHLNPGASDLIETTSGHVSRVRNAAPPPISGAGGVGRTYSEEASSIALSGNVGFSLENPFFMDIYGGNAFTFTVWMRVFNRDGSHGLNGYLTGSNSIRLGYFNESYFFDAGLHEDVKGSKKLLPFSWFEVTVVVDSYNGRSYKAYVDGEFIESGTRGVPGSLVNPSVFGIGKSAHAIGYGIDGEIGHVMMYNRGLRAEEVLVNHERLRGFYASDVNECLDGVDACTGAEECIDVEMGYQCRCLYPNHVVDSVCVLGDSTLSNLRSDDCDGGQCSSISSDWELLYDLDIPSLTPGWTYQSDVPYSFSCVSNASCPLKLERVAYLLELDSNWIWVTMYPYTEDAHGLGVPVSNVYQKPVQDMTVISAGTVSSQTRITGSMEFWPYTYSGSPFDANDVYSTSGYYGSMQFFDSSANTLFALNAFTRSGVSLPINLGIGNAASANKDWTDTAGSNTDALSYTIRRLRVFSLATDSLGDDESFPPGDQTPCAFIGEECDGNSWHLALSLDIGVTGVWQQRSQIAYSYDCTVNEECLSVLRRVAYLFELDDKWVWVSFRPYSLLMAKYGIPADYVYDGPIEDMVILSNHPNVHQAIGVTGSAEMWSHGYSGDPNGVLDHDDTRTANDGFGSFQMFDENNDVVFALNRWAVSSNNEMGFGNQPTGSPDWTFAANGSSYTLRRLRMYLSPSYETQSTIP